MPSRPLAALTLLLLSPDTLAAIPAGGRIVRVTVHPDRAEVTRRAEVRVPAGASEIEFSAIPVGIDEDSLAASGRGVGVAIGAVELREEVGEAVRSVDLDAADSEVRTVEAEIARLAAEEATDLELRKYLDSVRGATSRQQSGPTAALTPDTEALGRMMAFLRAGYADLAERDLQRRSGRLALEDRLRLAHARRQAAQPEGSTHSHSVRVGIEATAAGVLTLDLSYVVFDAAWRPAYRAALDAERKEIHLVSEAVVSQQSGEDWNGVTLTLTTADPAEDLEPPVLQSWLLAVSMPSVVTASDLDGGAVLDVPTKAIEGFKLSTSGFSSKYGEQSSAAARIMTAWLVNAGYQVDYVVPGTTDIASDDAEHRVTLREDTLAAELQYHAVPSLQSDAFALATTRAPADRPLFSGPVRVVAGGTLLGEFTLPETPPGAVLSVPFGVDNRVRVSRVELPQARSHEGPGGRDRQVVTAFRTTVENLRDVPVSITLEERLPVSQDERITVKLGNRTTGGHVEDPGRAGVLAWKLELEPKEKVDVTLEYSVRHPKDMVIGGS